MRFAVDLGPKIFKFFRGRKIFRPKSCEIAPKFLPIGGAQPCLEPKRSPSTVRSVGMLWRGGFRRDSDRKFSTFFAAAKFFVRNRARSRRTPCRLVTCSIATSQTSTKARCGASACCGAADFAAIRSENSQIFSRPQNFSFEIARDRAELPAD